MDGEIFIINLERRKDRLDSMKRQMQSAGINNYKIYGAFDNKVLSLSDSRGQTCRLGRGFIGVYLSHMAVLKTVLALNCKEVIVFEDDSVLKADFRNELEEIKTSLPDDWEMLYLHHGSSNRMQLESLNAMLLNAYAGPDI